MKDKSVTEKIYSKYSLNDIEKRMILLGYNDKDKTLNFLNFRLLTSIAIFFVILYFVEWGYIIAPIVVFLYYFSLPKILLDRRIERRRRKLENDAMYFFEVLALSIESGNNLYNAILVTSKNIDSELSLEFRKMMEEVDLGKSFMEALDSLKVRISSDIINNILLNIKESSMFGNSILGTLNNQIDYLRETKLLEMRAYISKIPLKISVISVLFFIPLLLLLILGPVLIDYLG